MQVCSSQQAIAQSLEHSEVVQSNDKDKKGESKFEPLGKPKLDGWVALQPPNVTALGTVLMLNKDTVWLGSDSGLFRSTDAGRTWIRKTFDLAFWQPILLRSAMDIWATRTGLLNEDRAGYLYRSTDGGESWIKASTSMRYINQIHMFDDSNGIISGADAISLTTNGGKRWKFMGLPGDLRAIAAFDRKNILVSGFSIELPQQPGVYRPPVQISRDSGKSWEFIGHLSYFDSLGSTYTSFLLDSNTAILGGAGGFVYTHDKGNTWKKSVIHNRPDIIEALGMWFTDKLTGYATCDHGRLAVTTDGGVSWDLLESGYVGDLRRISFADKLNGIITAEGVNLLHTATPEFSVKNAHQKIDLTPHNYPEPFSISTTVHYVLPNRSTVQVHLYDVNGRLIKTLLEPTVQAKGDHSIVISGNELIPGIYTYSIETDKATFSGKITLVR